MKIAVFYPSSLWCAWACSHGLVDALERMGHEIVAVPINPQRPDVAVTNADLDGCEGCIISGPEHLAPVLSKMSIFISKPTVGWMHETVEREDYGKIDISVLKSLCRIVFCPGIQDEQHGFRWLPFGVDTHVFNAGDGNTERKIPAGFIGLMYPKRQEFLKRLQPHLNGKRVQCGNVQVLEFDGVNPRKTVHLYAENIRRMKLFVNLPTLSQLAVTKVYEVLACGVPVLTPKVANMRNFQNLPAMFYEPTPESLAAQLHEESEVPSTLLAKVMHEQHRLELRCQTLVEALKEAA